MNGPMIIMVLCQRNNGLYKSGDLFYLSSEFHYYLVLVFSRFEVNSQVWFYASYGTWLRL